MSQSLEELRAELVAVKAELAAALQHIWDFCKCAGCNRVRHLAELQRQAPISPLEARGMQNMRAPRSDAEAIGNQYSSFKSPLR